MNSTRWPEVELGDLTGLLLPSAAAVLARALVDSLARTLPCTTARWPLAFLGRRAVAGELQCATPLASRQLPPAALGLADEVTVPSVRTTLSANVPAR